MAEEKKEQIGKSDAQVTIELLKEMVELQNQVLFQLEELNQRYKNPGRRTWTK